MDQIWPSPHVFEYSHAIDTAAMNVWHRIYVPLEIYEPYSVSFDVRHFVFLTDWQLLKIHSTPGLEKIILNQINQTSTKWDNEIDKVQSDIWEPKTNKKFYLFLNRSQFGRIHHRKQYNQQLMKCIQWCLTCVTIMMFASLLIFAFQISISFSFYANEKIKQPKKIFFFSSQIIMTWFQNKIQIEKSNDWWRWFKLKYPKKHKKI